MNKPHITSQKENAFSMIAKVMSKVRKPLHDIHFDGSLKEPAVYFEEANVNGFPYNVPLFILRTKPCSWLQSGGCSMCNYHLASALNRNVTIADLETQFNQVLEYVKGKKLPYILLTSAGSFLDDKEVPESVRLGMLKRLAKSGLKALTFESRAEFLTNKDKLLRHVEAFKEGNLSVGIGLESSDLFIRNTILHKGLSDRTLEKATETLKKTGITYYFYVMTGKPFLTFQEDVSDTIKTINRAFGLGGFMAVLEVVNIQPHTLTKELYDAKVYNPPSLWQAIDILGKISPNRRKMVPIKGYEKAEPMPLAFSITCPSCNEQMKRALREWNFNRNWQNFINILPDCSCKKQFYHETQKTNEIPLENRIVNLLNNVL